MSMSKHTPEPWKDGFLRVTALDGGMRIAVTSCGAGNVEIEQANANRIVTCVNACAGMEDPAAEIAELKRKRDELLGEFDQLMKFYDVDSVAGLIRAQEEHILRLQESVARKPFTQIIASSPVRGA